MQSKPHIYRFGRTHSTTAAILSVSFLLIHCAVFGPKDRSYSELVESFDTVDVRPLQGRVIVLDPGHGGIAPGAVGSSGLREKDINLKVALRLKYYLEIADARVIMTRSDDRDMIYSEYDSLRGDDLDYRVRTSNNNEVDLFISLHHNSNLPLNRDYNATETYYKMEDLYTSFDFARILHKHLVKNIQSPLNYLRP
ncbi:N-acetylmuramoyl-L-alanine amidase, partial [candidate division KSB1 bacterium]